MLKIEEEMKNFFLIEKERKERELSNKKEIGKLEPIKIGASLDDKKYNLNTNNQNIKIPFAYIGSLSEGSPAEEAGLRLDDGIINFDGKIIYGQYQNPLQKVAEIVKDKLDKVINVEVLRMIKDSDNFDKILIEKLELIPHKWSGQGVLGY